MVRASLSLLGLVLLVVVGVFAWSSRASALPYYSGRDFTPNWSPVAHRVGAFSGLTDQRGQAFGSEVLDGHVYVASFIFTSLIDALWHLVIFKKSYAEGIRPLARMSGEKMAFQPIAEQGHIGHGGGHITGHDMPERGCRKEAKAHSTPLTHKRNMACVGRGTRDGTTSCA